MKLSGGKNMPDYAKKTAHTLDDLQKKLQREQAVSRLAHQIRSSLSLQTILDTAVEQIQQIIGGDRVNIWKFEPDYSSVVVAESTCLPRSLMGKKVFDHCFQSNFTEIYREDYIRIVPDIDITEMTECHREFLREQQIRAKVLLPLFCRGQLWGLLNVVESQTTRDWQEDEIDLLRCVMTQLEIAIQQASTHEQLQAELRERLQVEAQLRQSNQRLQDAQRIAHLGNWELDLQHNTLYWSEEIFHIFEVDPQQFSPSCEAFLSFIHPDDLDAAKSAYRQHLRDRQPYSLVHRIPMADGRIKYVCEKCESAFSADGKPLFSWGTTQDITQQREMEMRRDRAEASLRQVIEGTAAVTGEAFFPALVRHVSEALGVRYVSVDQAMPNGFQVLSFFANGEFRFPKFVAYDAVPCCYQSLQDGSFCQPAGMQAIYPDNALFNELQVESYLGVRLQNAAGEPIGILYILHDAPLADPDWSQKLLTIFAARAGAELERLLTAQALEALNTELEERVSQRTAALVEREARYRGLLEGAADAILIADLQGNILEANQRAELLLGYPLAELTTLHFTQLHPATELDRIKVNFAEIVQKQHAQILDVICHRRDGSTVPVDITASVININGEIMVQGIFRDITDRRQTELALRESETRFRRVFDSNVVGMMFTDFNGVIYDANDRFLDIIGYSRADLAANRINWAEITPPEYVESDCQAIAYLQKHGEIAPWEKEYLRPDGSRVSVLLGVAMLLSKVDGRCVCVVIDISDRKAAEAKLQRTNAELERATRLKDEFLATMSHELRTPLNAILGMTEGLQEGIFGNINERQLNALSTVENSASHLLTLINDILDVSKIQSGKINLDYSQVSIEHLCSSSIAFVKQQAFSKRIQLITKISPHLPDILIDEIRMRQVLLNLLTNAVKFTLEGGTVTLTAALLPPESPDSQISYLHIAVTDTGIGITPENMTKLFQPFVQIDSALNRKYAGTGLGLALVKQIVELHGGRVGLTSELEVGSCFTVDLPYQIQVAPDAYSASLAIAIEPDHSPVNAPSLNRSPLVLLAEDNLANVVTISSYLEAKGYRLLFADNGQEAVALAIANHPDVILMDVQMPNVDGLEAMRQIRQQESLRHIPIIALTALAMKSDRDLCLAAGANHYLSKPVKLKQLDILIKNILAQP